MIKNKLLTNHICLTTVPVPNHVIDLFVQYKEVYHVHTLQYSTYNSSIFWNKDDSTFPRGRPCVCTVPHHQDQSCRVHSPATALTFMKLNELYTWFNLSNHWCGFNAFQCGFISSNPQWGKFRTIVFREKQVKIEKIDFVYFLTKKNSDLIQIQFGGLFI